MDLMCYLDEKRAVVEETLKDYFPVVEGHGAELARAMNYSLFASGKRLRPILCMAGAEAVGGDPERVLSVACGLELIHTYSLIHDDLPSMDDDELRRGKPTNHMVFGEALAILAGDALLTEAFSLMAMTDLNDKICPDTLNEVITMIASAAGAKGMVGGQAVDIQMEGKKIDPSLMEYIHTHKTGALISASVLSGVMLGGGSDSQKETAVSYGNKIGLAFQIADDILDIEGSTSEIGKPAGSDQEKGKNTYPAVYGLSLSKERLNDVIISAIKDLEQFDFRAEPLRQIARYIIVRKK